MPDFLIITVNYKGAEMTERYLESASKLNLITKAQILVVENGSNDGSAEKLRRSVQKYNNVRLLESATNRGYFGAANWALQQVLARGERADWIIVCNNDICFEDLGFLVRLFQHDSRTEAVIAPAIIAKQTGTDSNPFLARRPSDFQLLRYRFWQSNYYLMWFKQWLSPYIRILRSHLSRQLNVPKIKGPVTIYAPHGAFLIFGRRYFDAGGYIDDGFFLYAEEFSVAEICRNLGLSIIHDQELRVTHDAHHVTGRLCNRESYKQGHDAMEYVLRKYFYPGNSLESARSQP